MGDKGHGIDVGEAVAAILLAVLIGIAAWIAIPVYQEACRKHWEEMAKQKAR